VAHSWPKRFDSGWALRLPGLCFQNRERPWRIRGKSVASETTERCARSTLLLRCPTSTEQSRRRSRTAPLPIQFRVHTPRFHQRSRLVSKTVTGLWVRRGFQSLPLRLLEPKARCHAGWRLVREPARQGTTHRSKPLDAAPEWPSLARRLARTRAFEVRVQEPCRLVLATGEEMPIAVERDRDRRLPEVRRQRLCIHSAAIINDAKVCLASWSPIGSSFAAVQTRFARANTPV
jgi:hypothetical protein